MSQAVGSFITSVMMHFPFRHDSPEKEAEWTASMVRNLRGYAGDVLKKAAQRIIDTRTDRRFPLPSECKNVCEDIHRVDKLTSLPVEPPPSKYAEWSESRIKLADDLIASEIGRQAARDGWVLSLHDFVRQQMRLPSASEIGRVKAGARGFDEAYEICLRGEGGLCNAALVKLGEMMVARREKLRAQVLGEAA